MYIIFLFIILLLLSGFFSGSETAFLNLKKHHKSIPSNVLKISKKSKILLIGLLSGSTIVIISIAFCFYMLHLYDIHSTHSFIFIVCVLYI